MKTPTPLVCWYGEPWLGPHPICAAAHAATCGVPVAEVIVADFSKFLPPNAP